MIQIDDRNRQSKEVSQPSEQAPEVNNQTQEESWLVSVPKSIVIDGKEYCALGQGAQATAYVNRHQTVKIGHSLSQLDELYSRNGSPNPTDHARENYEAWFELLAETRSHIESGRLNSELFADTRIDQQGRIWQSFVVPVEEQWQPSQIGKYDPSDIKNLINKFANITQLGWTHGVCEKECSLFANYALRPLCEKLTIPDFGSVTYSYDDAKKSIAGQVSNEDVEGFLAGKAMPQKETWPDWFFKGEVREALRGHPELFHYYVDTMSSKITFKNLDQLWPNRYK